MTLGWTVYTGAVVVDRGTALYLRVLVDMMRYSSAVYTQVQACWYASLPEAYDEANYEITKMTIHK